MKMYLYFLQLIFGINRALFSSYRTVFIANMTCMIFLDGKIGNFLSLKALRY